jgi:hypothetical protein
VEACVAITATGVFAMKYSSSSGSVITAYGADLDTKKIDWQAISNPAVHGYVRRQLDGWDSMWRGMGIKQMESPTGRALILKACNFCHRGARKGDC